MTSALVKAEKMETASASNPIAATLQAIVDKGLTSDNAAALEKITDLYMKVEAENARKAFNTAFCEMQEELPAIQPTKAVPNNDGSTRYMYAPYDSLMKIVGPVMRKHGFSPSFSTKFSDGRVTSICTLIHIGGHERTNEYSVRIGKGPPGSSDSQADGAANQYAQRGALCDALNIVILGRDNDARDLGGCITPDQAEDFRQRVHETRSDEKAFLKFAGGASFETIPETRWKELDAFLRRKEGRA